MPNAPKPDEVILSVRVKRTTHKRVVKLAEKRKTSISEVVRSIINANVEDTVLTPEDYVQIAKDTKEAQRRKDRGNKPSQSNLEARNYGSAQKAGSKGKNDD